MWCVSVHFRLSSPWRGVKVVQPPRRNNTQLICDIPASPGVLKMTSKELDYIFGCFTSLGCCQSHTPKSKSVQANERSSSRNGVGVTAPRNDAVVWCSGVVCLVSPGVDSRWPSLCAERWSCVFNTFHQCKQERWPAALWSSPAVGLRRFPIGLAWRRGLLRPHERHLPSHGGVAISGEVNERIIAQGQRHLPAEKPRRLRGSDVMCEQDACAQKHKHVHARRRTVFLCGSWLP